MTLHDLLAVVREFLNAKVSRPGLDRCLRRHGVGNLRVLKPAAPRPAHKPFKACEPGYVDIDVKYLPTWRMRKAAAISSSPSVAWQGI